MPKFRYLFVVLAGLASGCEAPETTMTGPETREAVAAAMPSVPPEKALIYVYRTKAFGGSANIYRLSVDGSPVADLAVGTKYESVVEPGTVRISAATVPNILNFGLNLALQSKPSVDIQLPRGSAVAIEVSSGFSGGPVFTQKTLEQAQAASTGFKAAQAQ